MRSTHKRVGTRRYRGGYVGGGPPTLRVRRDPRGRWRCLSEKEESRVDVRESPRRCKSGGTREIEGEDGGKRERGWNTGLYF